MDGLRVERPVEDGMCRVRVESDVRSGAISTYSSASVVSIVWCRPGAMQFAI